MEKALTKLKGYVKKAKILSITDSLTGLLNHNQFDETLQTEINRNSRQKQPLSLAIIDIDYFKNYNDFYGHPQGDVCIKEISNLISKTCSRAGENAYRIGGEEFAIIMPNTTGQQHYKKLKKLQSALKDKNIEHKHSKVSDSVTISIGIYSCIPEKNLKANIYYKNADTSLYTAKEKRNSIEIFTNKD